MRLWGRQRTRDPAALEPITFVPVRRVFKPQSRIRMLNDVSGWVGPKSARKRFALAAGRTYALDEEKAREYVAKGFAEFVDEPRQPLSEDEIAEFRSQVTTLRPGA